MSWITVKSFDEVNKGDLIIGTNYTWSLKYADKLGYEQYNNSRKGFVISEKHTSWFDIIIVNENNEEEYAVYDCGSSGEFYIQKYLETNNNK
jgi:hypothetical protein